MSARGSCGSWWRAECELLGCFISGLGPASRARRSVRAHSGAVRRNFNGSRGSEAPALVRARYKQFVGWRRHGARVYTGVRGAPCGTVLIGWKVSRCQVWRGAAPNRCARCAAGKRGPSCFCVDSRLWGAALGAPPQLYDSRLHWEVQIQEGQVSVQGGGIGVARLRELSPEPGRDGADGQKARAARVSWQTLHCSACAWADPRAHVFGSTRHRGSDGLEGPHRAHRPVRSFLDVSEVRRQRRAQSFTAARWPV